MKMVEMELIFDGCLSPVSYVYNYSLILKKLEDIRLFCVVTDTHVFGFLVTSDLGFKTRVDLTLVWFLSCVQ